jgi:hypothetical protein
LDQAVSVAEGPLSRPSQGPRREVRVMALPPRSGATGLWCLGPTL